MNYKKIIPIIIICILTIIIIAFITSNSHEDVVDVNNTTNNEIKYDTNIIENIKNEINSTADTNMFQVETEYDGRPIIQIKPEIQYTTVLAGIIENKKPEESEIEEILKKVPTETGVWISEQSRENFLNLLSKNNINNFSIDDNGYLKIDKTSNDNNSKQLENMINSEYLYIVDMSGTCYMRDDVSGEIIEYPFEEMDPYQLIEPFSDENNIIFVMTTNSENLMTDEEMLDGLLAYAEK